MKFSIILLLLSLNASVKLSGQRPVQLLNNWSAQFPVEKVYLHTDRENYLAGDTAWFKAYLSSVYQPDTISTVLYTELWADSVTLLQKKFWPVLLGISNGQLELPDTLRSGIYLLRAYTPTQLNQRPEFLYQRTIYIHGKKVAQPAEAATARSSLRLDFFPEGGNLVRGLTQTVAIKATDPDGFPAAFSGRLMSEKGEQVATVSTYRHGLGLVTFTPENGVAYYVEPEGSTQRFSLPAAENEGIAFSVIPHPQGFFFEIQQQRNEGPFAPAYIIGQMQHQVVLHTSLRAGQAGLQGVLDTRSLRSGILQLTVFNKDDMPLAERLCFVQNNRELLKAELIADTLSVLPKGRNRFTLQLSDTVAGSFSISVTDADYDLFAQRNDHIVSRFLLTSDLAGYVHEPAWYFSTTPDSASMGLDLLLMTHGWRRFKWTALMKDGVPASPVKDPGFIRLQGKAFLRDTKRPFENSALALMISGPHTRRITQLLQTDARGQFAVDSLIFYERSRLLFSDVRGKKSKYIDIVLSADSLRRDFALPSPYVYRGIRKTSLAGTLAGKMADDYKRQLDAGGKMLEEVRLTVTRKSPLQQVEERYTRGIFSGESIRSIDLVNNDEANTYLNIFDYLQNRVNGLQIMSNGLDYGIFYRQGPVVSSMGNIPMTLFLDEIETDVSVIATIPASQVALVKVYNTFAGAWGNAPGGALAIYTKKEGDISVSSGFANLKFYEGYSVVKEFYAPGYAARKDLLAQPDFRITLDWRPSVFVNHVNPKIPFSFYNNDRTRRFRVVAEGMTTDGRMLLIDKIVEGP